MTTVRGDAESSARHQAGLFRNAPVALLEEDYSGIKAYLDALGIDTAAALERHRERQPDALRECAERLRYVSANRAAVELLEAEDPDALAGGPPRHFTQAAYHALTGPVAALLSPGGIVQAETEIRTHRGRIVPVHVSRDVRRLHDGPPFTATASLIDISLQVAAEEELRESEARYRHVVEDQTEFIVRWLPDGTRTFVNAAYCRFFQQPREDLVGTSFLPLVAKGDREAVMAQLEVLTPDDPVVTEEHGVLLPDGRAGWQRWTNRAIFDAEGRIVELQSVGRDVTERKLAEEALRASQERFSKAFRQSPDAITISHLDDGRFIDVNDGFERISGYTRAEAVAKTSHELGLWVDSARREEVVRELEHENGTAAKAVEFRRKSGEVRLCEVSAELISVGDEACILAVTRDVTENVRAEEALHAAVSELQALKDRLEEENIYLREEIKHSHDFEGIIGGSSGLEKALRQIGEVAPTDSTVLIIGETGTGKELVARAIHAASPRQGRPLVKVDCAALPATLIENELFGHERGAFTGADARQRGRFELAHGGTLFLDEVGNLPLELQGKLLRALQEGEIERVGGTRTITVDVRIIAATNRDLRQAVDDGGFRPDLYYRLNVYPIALPPLRDRKEDMPVLVDHFVAKHAKRLGKTIETISAGTLARLDRYSWPGNVRELENVVERAIISSRGSLLEIEDPGSAPFDAASAEAALLSLEAVEREHILTVLEENDWVIEGSRGASTILGLPPSSLRSRMKRLGIKRPDRS